MAAIYKSRWLIQLFFKWIKQNLKIKAFMSTSKNTVTTQMWIALCVYLLIAYLKFQLKNHAIHAANFKTAVNESIRKMVA